MCVCPFCKIKVFTDIDHVVQWIGLVLSISFLIFCKIYGIILIITINAGVIYDTFFANRKWYISKNFSNFKLKIKLNLKINKYFLIHKWHRLLRFIFKFTQNTAHTWAFFLNNVLDIQSFWHTIYKR